VRVEERNIIRANYVPIVPPYSKSYVLFQVKNVKTVFCRGSAPHPAGGDPSL